MTERKAGDVTVDLEANMAYIYLEDKPAGFAPWGKIKSIEVCNAEGHTQFVIDTDPQGKLLGIEVFGVEHLGGAARVRAIDLSKEDGVRDYWNKLKALLGEKEVSEFHADEAISIMKGHPITGELDERVARWLARKKK